MIDWFDEVSVYNWFEFDLVPVFDCIIKVSVFDQGLIRSLYLIGLIIKEPTRSLLPHADDFGAV